MELLMLIAVIATLTAVCWQVGQQLSVKPQEPARVPVPVKRRRK